MNRVVAILFALIVTTNGLAATLDGGTLFIVDTSGSGGGQGVGVATDSGEFRGAVLRGLFEQPWLKGVRRVPPIAVVTCGGRTKILLAPTNDRSAIHSFLKDVQFGASGATTISATLELLPQVPGRPANVVYVGDGLLTGGDEPSAEIVRRLPQSLASIYGTTPRLHIIAIDSSGKTFDRTASAWNVIAKGRVARVRVAADIAPSIALTSRNLGWTPRQSRPAPTPSAPRNWLTVQIAAAALAFVVVGALLKLRRNRSPLNALITIEENGQTRRASARTFGKPAVSIGDGTCDVKVAKWEKPITLLQREVLDRRGRKRRQTIAQQGNRSVILGTVPVSFRNGTTTVRVRGGRS